MNNLPATPNTLDDQMRLSANLERVRRLVNDKEIHNLLQNKQYFTLAQNMSELARLAHECNGILFSFHLRINTHILEEVSEPIVDPAKGLPQSEEPTEEPPQ